MVAKTLFIIFQLHMFGQHYCVVNWLVDQQTWRFGVCRRRLFHQLWLVLWFSSVVRWQLRLYRLTQDDSSSVGPFEWFRGMRRVNSLTTTCNQQLPVLTDQQKFSSSSSSSPSQFQLHQQHCISVSTTLQHHAFVVNSVTHCICKFLEDTGQKNTGHHMKI